MRDPDIVFMFQHDPHCSIAEPVSFRNDYLGLDQQVYRYDETGKRTHLDTKLKSQLREFAQTWFANLNEQGFFGDQALCTILSP